MKVGLHWWSMDVVVDILCFMSGAIILGLKYIFHFKLANLLNEALNHQNMYSSNRHSLQWRLYGKQPGTLSPLMIIPSQHISPSIAASSPDGFTFVQSVHYEFPFLCSDEPREGGDW